MRRLATELGCGVMSLYSHVPSKSALLDGVADTVMSGIETTSVPEPAGRSRSGRKPGRSVRSPVPIRAAPSSSSAGAVVGQHRAAWRMRAGNAAGRRIRRAGRRADRPGFRGVRHGLAAARGWRRVGSDRGDEDEARHPRLRAKPTSRPVSELSAELGESDPMPTSSSAWICSCTRSAACTPRGPSRQSPAARRAGGADPPAVAARAEAGRHTRGSSHISAGACALAPPTSCGEP